MSDPEDGGRPAAVDPMEGHDQSPEPGVVTVTSEAMPGPPPTGGGDEHPHGRESSRARSILAGARRKFFDLDLAWLVLLALMVLWAVVFGTLVWRRHDRFSSYGFDMAIFDQAVWLLSRFGTQFMTMRGLSVFGHHGSFALYLFVPFYWLGAGAHFLNLAQVAAIASGAIPVFLLARHRLGNKWFAVVLAAVYLAHPSLGYLAWELFHPEVMAIPCLLFAYWFAIRRRWWWFAAFCIFAVAWKEDVALAVVALGLVIALRGNTRVGFITVGAAIVWFVFVSRVMIPRISGESAFYLQFFSDLGDTPWEIVSNIVAHPSRLGRRLFAPDAKDYLWKMTAPFGFVPILAPDVLLLGIPQALVNIISVNDFTRRFEFHYAALPLTALTLATVEGIAFFTRRRQALRPILVGLVAASSLMATTSWGVSPIGDHYRQGWWPLAEDARRDSKIAALEVVPDDAGVSATYQFDSHLAHREKIYEFPNPFKPSNWGVANENYPSADEAEWLAVDTQILQGGDRQVYQDILASGEFEVRFEREGIVVAERVKPAAAPPAGSASS